jgi:hypothetical protein
MIRRLTPPTIPPELAAQGWALDRLPGGYYWCINSLIGDETYIYDAPGKAIEHCWRLFDPHYERINKLMREIEKERHVIGIGPHPFLARVIQDLAAEAERLAAQTGYDSGAWDDLYERIETLDSTVRLRLPPGQLVAPGRYLTFSVADGKVWYIIDQVAGDRVHCTWIAEPDGYRADAVDADGWTLRSIAEQQIGRRRMQ